MSSFTPRETIIEIVNKLFIYTDNRNWQGLLDEVFTEDVLFDISSLGGGNPVTMKAKEICNNWEIGFIGVDSVHHQAGNYLVSIKNDAAEVYAYAIALHYKEAAKHGKTRQFTGSYDLKLVVTEKGWRMNVFKYNLKFMDGNVRMD